MRVRLTGFDRYRIALLVLIAIKLVLGLNTIFATRLWIGHEDDFFRVMRFITTDGRLPIVSDYPDRITADLAQATQPPLYYLIGYPVVLLFDDGQPVPPPQPPSIVCDAYRRIHYPLDPWPPQGTQIAAYALRLLNLLFATSTALLTYGAGTLLFPQHKTVALIGAAFIAFEPRTYELSTTINIDSLVLLLSSINLYFAARLISTLRLTWKDVGGLVITALLAILAKPNGWAVVLATVAVIMVVMVPQIQRKRWDSLRNLSIIGLGLLVMIFLVGLYNLSAYGSVVGRYEGIIEQLTDNTQLAFSASLAGAVFNDTKLDYRSAFPIQREKALLLYVGVTLAALGSAALAAVGSILCKNRMALSAMGLLLGYLAITVIMVVLRNSNISPVNLTQAVGPVRYYVTGLSACALLMSLGFEAVTRHLIGKWLPKWGWIAGGAWALLWLAIVVWNTFAGATTPAFVLDARGFAEANARPVYTTEHHENIITLAYTTSVEDDVLVLDIYNTLAEKTSENHIIGRIDLLDAGGTAVSCEFLPAGGLHPTWRWETDDIIASQVVVPNCSSTTLEHPFDIELSWYRLDGNDRIDVASMSTVSLGQMETDLPPSAGCHSNLGVFADTFQVVKFNSPPTAIAGEFYLPSVNWYVHQTLVDTNVARFYTLTHINQDAQYECHGIPRLQNDSFETWNRGEVIYFDECRFRFPRNAPPGTYTIAVHMTDSEGNPLPATSGNGLSENGGITVGSVELESAQP
nr:hypothetical protein [Anaerolineae bacterium]